MEKYHIKGLDNIRVAVMKQAAEDYVQAHIMMYKYFGKPVSGFELIQAYQSGYVIELHDLDIMLMAEEVANFVYGDEVVLYMENLNPGRFIDYCERIAKESYEKNC